MTWSTHHPLFFNISITYSSFPEALGDTNLRLSLPESTWRIWTPKLQSGYEKAKSGHRYATAARFSASDDAHAPWRSDISHYLKCNWSHCSLALCADVTGLRISLFQPHLCLPRNGQV